VMSRQNGAATGSGSVTVHGWAWGLRLTRDGLGGRAHGGVVTVFSLPSSDSSVSPRASTCEGRGGESVREREKQGERE
jgi:hypothetical protein